MERFIYAIRKSVEECNWFSALFLALAVPDICGALENPPTGRKGEIGERYRDWYNRFLKSKYSPENLYELALSNNHNYIAKMAERDIEHLKATPLNENCSFSAEDCYRFRCKCLHQGLIEKEGGETFMFITPPPNGNIVHMNYINGLYQLQIDVFCKDICLAAENWLEEIKDNQEVLSRINELINIHHFSTLNPAIKFGCE